MTTTNVECVYSCRRGSGIVVRRKQRVKFVSVMTQERLDGFWQNKIHAKVRWTDSEI